ncbi:hypothetical protein MLD38_002759 [Melastoma candidum]|uniref:Uncharacterized protein n=1 Tax=Melastoma candidum TaxID=119954 RepID=A0ACB9S3H5_9MYRT|nr:hypothetical protein MLD38_002759 [Melastoma candidum]
MEGSFAEEIYSESMRSSSRVDSSRAPAAGSDPDDFDGVWEDEESWNESERLDREGRARRLQHYNIGYRDGVVAGKEASAQEGFNAGVKQSVGSGYKLGLVRGVTTVLHCLPDALKAKLVESDECRVKIARLYESVQSLSTSDALKIYANEIMGGKTSQPGSSSADVCSSLDGLSVTSQPSVLTSYFEELQSLLVQSPGIEVRLEKSL